MKTIKQITSLFLLLALMLSFAACAKQYSVIFDEAPTWLYEELESHYLSGDSVRVRIGKVDGVRYLFLVNGKRYSCEFESDDFWQFSFTMPREEAIIEFKTYDAAVTDPDEITLIEQYLLSTGYQDGVTVQKLYGKYESGAIAAIISAGNYDSILWEETVAGEVFRYQTSNRILVLQDQTFLTLEEAYNQGYLTQSDVSAICQQHKTAYADLYA